MKKKSVLFVINSFGLGGAEKSLVSLLPLFDYEKYDVDVMVLSKGGIFDSLVDERVHRLELLPFLKFCTLPLSKQLLSFQFKFLFARLRLALMLKMNAKSKNKKHDAQIYWQCCKNCFDSPEKEYDLAIGWGQGVPVKYVSTKVRAKKKAVWINADYTAAGHKREDDLENFSKVDTIVSVSKALNEQMKKVFPEYEEKMRVIYDIQNAQLIEKMADAEKVFENEKRLKIVTAGRLNRVKGYDIAVDTCKILKEKGYDLVWYAVGEGPERGRLEKQITQNGMQDTFVLLGAKANPYPYMKNADIYVQTSRFEGYCLTLAEARILNTPCVTTEFECVYNQMIDEKNGLVVKINPQSVADAVSRLIEDKQLYQSIQAYLKTEKKGNTEEIEKVYELFD
ncbi:MAG: glycosyltransferase [Acutalibacteraceae bacterium]